MHSDHDRSKVRVYLAAIGCNGIYIYFCYALLHQLAPQHSTFALVLWIAIVSPLPSEDCNSLGQVSITQNIEREYVHASRSIIRYVLVGLL